MGKLPLQVNQYQTLPPGVRVKLQNRKECQYELQTGKWLQAIIKLLPKSTLYQEVGIKMYFSWRI